MTEIEKLKEQIEAKYKELNEARLRVDKISHDINGLEFQLRQMLIC